MREIIYDPIKDEELKRFFVDLEAETDKGAASDSYAFIEELLKELIKKRLIINKNKRMKSYIGRLHGSPLIWLNYSVGVLREEEADDLGVLCEIRNLFDHNRKVRSFGHKLVSEKCQKLRPLHQPWAERTDKIFFFNHVAYYIQILRVKLLQTNRIRVVEKEYPKTIAMFENLLVLGMDEEIAADTK